MRICSSSSSSSSCNALPLTAGLDRRRRFHESDFHIAHHRRGTVTSLQPRQQLSERAAYDATRTGTMHTVRPAERSGTEWDETIRNGAERSDAARSETGRE